MRAGRAGLSLLFQTLCLRLNTANKKKHYYTYFTSRSTNDTKKWRRMKPSPRLPAGLRHFLKKHEILNPKPETNPKSKCSKFKTKATLCDAF
jgi:hypothetical protein